jgi:hypothetical protein
MKFTVIPSPATAPVEVISVALMMVELVPLATKELDSALRLIPATAETGLGADTPTNSMVNFWVTPWALAMIVAVPATPASLMNGTMTVPDPPLVVADTVLAPTTLKRPMSVVKVTAVPSTAGLPEEVINVAAMVVELTPSAGSEVWPAVRVMPTTGLVAAGVVEGMAPEGVAPEGVVPEGVAPEGVELGGGSSACWPPPPAFWQPAKLPTHTKLNETSSQPHACHPRLGRTYRYLLL